MASLEVPATPPTATTRIVEPLPSTLLSPDRALIRPISPSSGNTRPLQHRLESHNGDSTSFVWSEDLGTERTLDVEAQTFQSQRGAGIYWRSPAGMLIWFLLGTLMAHGHYLYYRSLDGQVVGDVDEQQRKLRYGTIFAFVTQFSLVSSVGIAYTQWLWKTLRKRSVTVAALDKAFTAPEQITSMFSPEMLRKIKLGSLIALIAWCLQIPSLITPATLSVIPSVQSVTVDAQVPCLNISTNATNQYNRFTYSTPIQSNTVQDFNDTSQIFVGPRTIVSRLSASTATSGQILPINPPFPNSSYALRFYAPSVKCSDANNTETGIIDRLLKLKMTIPSGIFLPNDTTYFAFVPDDYIMNGGIVNDTDVVQSISETRMQRHLNASNQLWATFNRFVLDTDGARQLERQFMICRLYNASYDVNLSFNPGNQTVTKNSLQLLNEIDYPKDDTNAPTNFANHAYSAFMWVLTDQLVGSMDLWIDNATDQKFSEISTPLEHNSLLGSVDLDPFFDYHSRIYQSNYTTGDRPLGDQRREDKNLAGNRTLAVLIEELSFNTTISLMSSTLLSPLVTVPVLRTTLQNVYAHNIRNLWLSYGLAIFFALLANLLGLWAYSMNKCSHDRSFSIFMSATRGPDLGELYCHESHGVLPTPARARAAMLRFDIMDEGGRSFRVMGRKEWGEGWRGRWRRWIG